MQNDKHLVLLHKISPLSKVRQLLLWLKIKKQLKLGFLDRINAIIKALGAVFITFVITLSTINLRADIVVLEGAKTGWDAVIDGDELKISAVNPAQITKSQVCVLWVKNDNKTKMLAKLPDFGDKTITLDKDTLDNIKNSEILISIENKDNITLPVKLEYQGKVN